MSLRAAAAVTSLALAGADFESYQGGRCVGVVGLLPSLPIPILANGNKFGLLDCGTRGRQKFLFHPEYTGGEIRLDVSILAFKLHACLDASDMTIGSEVQLWDCNGSDQQKWAYDAKMRRFYLPGTAICLDLPGGDSVSAGSHLWLWECNGASSQRWVYDNSRQGIFDLNAHIAYGDSLSCLRSSSGSPENGAVLTADECAETSSVLSDSERWMLGSDWFGHEWDRHDYAGPLRLKAAQGSCVDGALMEDGSQVYLWECNGLPQQDWDFDPDVFRLFLKASSPKVCLVRSFNPYGLFLSTCDSSEPLQRWVVDRQPLFDEIRACPSCAPGSARVV